MENIKPDEDVQTDEHPDAPEPGFGEQDEAAQEAEWIEDAQEGGDLED